MHHHLLRAAHSLCTSWAKLPKGPDLQVSDAGNDLWMNRSWPSTVAIPSFLFKRGGTFSQEHVTQKLRLPFLRGHKDRPRQDSHHSRKESLKTDDELLALTSSASVFIRDVPSTTANLVYTVMLEHESVTTVDDCRVLHYITGLTEI
jgi:hypothetical protein